MKFDFNCMYIGRQTIKTNLLPSPALRKYLRTQIWGVDKYYFLSGTVYYMQISIKVSSEVFFFPFDFIMTIVM